MLTLSAHKFYGPVGAGALFVRDLAKRNSVSPLMFGGGQEHGPRPGTLSVPAIVGLGAACQLAVEQMTTWAEHTKVLRSRFESRLLHELSDVSINGDINNRLPHVTNIAFHGADNEGLLAMLPDIIASTGYSMIDIWSEHLYFYFAEVSVGVSTKQCKTSLLDALLPPCNEKVYSAKLGNARKAVLNWNVSGTETNGDTCPGASSGNGRLDLLRHHDAFIRRSPKD